MSVTAADTPRPEAVADVPPPSGRVRGRRLDGAGAAEVDVAVAAEVPVALVYDGVSHAVMMATPADLEDFALGFSLSEGIVAAPGEVRALDIVPVAGGIEARLSLAPRRVAALAERRRTLAGRTGCGLCGVDSLAQAVRPPRRLGPGPTIPRAAIDRALDEVRAHQPLNADLHALHAAAWATADGAIRLAREDVGRHNALDKLIGALARGGTDPATGFALITSRCSVEMVQKAAEAGIAVLVAVSAPTSLAIDLAEAAGLTLVASARPGRITAFAHPGRLA